MNGNKNKEQNSKHRNSTRYVHHIQTPHLDSSNDDKHTIGKYKVSEEPIQRKRCKYNYNKGAKFCGQS